MPTKAEKKKEERTTHKKSVHTPKKTVHTTTRFNIRKSPVLPALPGGQRTLDAKIRTRDVI